MELAKIALDLDQLPNTSYLPYAIASKVRKLLQSIPVMKTVEDHLAIYAHYSRGKPRTKLVIDTHLDHPGFILVNQTTAIAIGSIAAPELISSVNSHVPVSVDLFSYKGEFIAEGYLRDFQFENSRLIAKVNANPSSLKFEPNIQAIPQFSHKGLRDSSLFMRSADNHSVTAVALVLAKWLSESQPEADVSFIFTKLEEVKQVSATLIARRNGTPFGNFDQCTHIIVLEAPSVGQTEGSKNIFDTRPSYDAGLIIRISDNDLIYVIDRQPNLAESLALHAADSSQISYQHAPLISNCNATAYTLFGQCPNVISLAVPCRNKHNFDPEGQFVLEMVSITDLSDLLNILQSLVISAQKPIDLHPARIIDPDRRHRGNHTKQLRNKRKDWLRTALAAEPKLRAERLFPESLVERTRFIYTSVRARLVNRP